MSVVEFSRPVSRLPGAWDADELQQFVALVATHVRQHGAEVSWDVGTTEAGDPQFYLVGPAPNFECLLSCSRVEARYVLEDGAGGVISEARSLRQTLEAATRMFARRRSAFIARVLLLFATLRITIEQKFEPVMAESSEWLARFEPQLAALV
jgi:hypothetical protein